MVFTKWFRPQHVLVVVVAVASGALACSDSKGSGAASNRGITEPNFTLASGFTSTLIGRGNLGPFHVKSRANGYEADLKSHDNTDIAVANVAIAPGGHSGWHFHPGPVLVVVKTGVITFYHGARKHDNSEGDDDGEGDHNATCSPTRHVAGTTFIEAGGDVGIARNEGAIEATAVATFFVPAGSPTRIDAPAPGNCPF